MIFRYYDNLVEYSSPPIRKKLLFVFESPSILKADSEFLKEFGVNPAKKSNIVCTVDEFENKKEKESKIPYIICKATLCRALKNKKTISAAAAK